MMLLDKLKQYRIIMASNSPRRRQLLKDAGIEYVLPEPYDVDEVYPQNLSPEDVPSFLSGLKSESYPHKLQDNDILITADTVVCLDGEVLGKPTGRIDAMEMLGRLSEKKHKVITGVTMRNAVKQTTFSAESSVWFRKLSEEEIAYYVDNYKPYDKAGAYGIQEWIGYIGIEKIEGSFYNVMGLPIQQLYINLEKFIFT